MKKLMIVIVAAGIIGGGAVAAHSSDDPTIDNPSWVRPNGTEIRSQIPKWIPVLGSRGQVVGYARMADQNRNVMPVFSHPGGRPIGSVGSRGFKANRQ
jgi:hypothetical protein